MIEPKMPFEPLTQEESLELAVLLDNVEEHLRAYGTCDSEVACHKDRYRMLLRRWVDRLCE